ncbi:MAG: tetratricopeptide repeat protein [Candidatus Korobacteraceae bacterium]
MQRVERTVFISYRRTNVPWALAIFQNLTQYGYDVFFDYSGISSGDFKTVILENIRARAHFLVILTPSALERCGEPEDWLRREIETALEERRNIVPLMLEGFDFGTPTIAKQLTGTLAPLKFYNALNVPADYFMEAMGRLRDRFLNIPLDAVAQPASLPARKAAAEQKKEAAAAPKVEEEELTAQQWFERGVNAVDSDEKLRFYSNAIRLKPDYVVALNNRGFVRRGVGDIDGALADFNQAILLDQSYAKAFNNRGTALYAKGDVAGALEDFRKAIALRPDSSLAHNNMGYALFLTGQLDDALEHCDEAIRLTPGLAAAFDSRGVVREAKGDLEGALQDYDEAIRIKPDHSDALCNRANLLFKKGNLEGALRDYNEAIRLKPDFQIAIANRDAVLKAIADGSNKQPS